jgi:hypothetical protein
MCTTRLKIEMAKGRPGVDLMTLIGIVEETSKFLESLGHDLNEQSGGPWIARNFENGSVMFDIEKGGLSPESEQKWRRGLRTVLSHSREDAEMNAIISRRTRFQLKRVATRIPVKERLVFSLYGGEESALKESYTFHHARAKGGAKERPEAAKYFGEVQGIVHAFYKETKNPRLELRELSTRNLISCYFNSEMYAAAVEVLHERDAVVVVQGEVSEDASGEIAGVRVTDFKLAPKFDEDWFEAHIGAFAGALTGEKSPGAALYEHRK